MEAITVLKEG